MVLGDQCGRELLIAASAGAYPNNVGATHGHQHRTHMCPLCSWSCPVKGRVGAGSDCFLWTTRGRLQHENGEQCSPVAVDKETRLETSCTHCIRSCSIAHHFHVVSTDVAMSVYRITWKVVCGYRCIFAKMCSVRRQFYE